MRRCKRKSAGLGESKSPSEPAGKFMWRPLPASTQLPSSPARNASFLAHGRCSLLLSCKRRAPGSAFTVACCRSVRSAEMLSAHLWPRYLVPCPRCPALGCRPTPTARPPIMSDSTAQCASLALACHCTGHRATMCIVRSRPDTSSCSFKVPQPHPAPHIPVLRVAAV